jgi:hypothetical protein
MVRRLAATSSGRNSKRSLRGARAQRKYGTKTPSDSEVKAKEVAERAKRFAAARAAGKQTIRGTPVKQKSPTSTSQPSKQTQPKKDKNKPKKQKPSFTSYLSEQTPANARNAIDNASGRNTGASTVSNRDSYSGSRYKKSLDQALYNLTSVMKQDEVQQECRLWKAELNETFNNLLDNYQDLYKNEQSTQARMTGNNLNTKIRQRKQEGSIRDKPTEVKTGDSFNLESRIGDAALRKALELIDILAKGTYEDDKFNESQGKGKRKPITNSGRSGAGSLGSYKKTPALGMTDDDKNIMQS